MSGQTCWIVDGFHSAWRSAVEITFWPAELLVPRGFRQQSEEELLGGPDVTWPLPIVGLGAHLRPIAPHGGGRQVQRMRDPTEGVIVFDSELRRSERFERSGEASKERDSFTNAAKSKALSIYAVYVAKGWKYSIKSSDPNKLYVEIPDPFTGETHSIMVEPGRTRIR